MGNKENWEITILDPKVKGILEELQNLDLIQIHKTTSNTKKQEFIEMLAGRNLKDIDLSEIKVEP